jgi:IS1 family transposase
MRNGLAIASPFDMGFSKTYQRSSFYQELRPDPFPFQKIERKHTTLRARIKRLVQKTICFSRSILMHDLVIGLFINRYEFGYAV